MTKHPMPATLVLLAAGALTACGGGYAGAYYAVPTAPPPPPAYGYGAVGVAPGPGHVWVNGYYDWRGGSYAWVRGSWVRPPRSRAVWVAPAYRPYGHGYRYFAGHWR
jgi:hypothetical protein